MASKVPAAALAPADAVHAAVSTAAAPAAAPVDYITARDILVKQLGNAVDELERKLHRKLLAKDDVDAFRLYSELAPRALVALDWSAKQPLNVAERLSMRVRRRARLESPYFVSLVESAIPLLEITTKGAMRRALKTVILQVLDEFVWEGPDAAAACESRAYFQDHPVGAIELDHRARAIDFLKKFISKARQIQQASASNQTTNDSFDSLAAKMSALRV